MSRKWVGKSQADPKQKVKTNNSKHLTVNKITRSSPIFRVKSKKQRKNQKHR